MFPYKTSLKLDRKRKQPLYLQLACQFIVLIKDGKLPPKTKLLGSRPLANLLNVHRKTIVACYEELDLQGWINTIPKKGTFVHANIPILKRQDYGNKNEFNEKEISGFSFYTNKILNRKQSISDVNFMYLNDGICDVRLTPTNEIAKMYRQISSKKSTLEHLSYSSIYGNLKLREVLVAYLNKTRGLGIKVENILITRGSQMGIFLASQLLLKKNDIILVGKTNYISANISFERQNAKLVYISVDQNGLVTDEIKLLCKSHSIKAVFVTSHHHHPTTVTLSAERRIHLLNLAKMHHFAIIEDDYDYDFNYNHAPILPLASHDTNGNVIYIGSFCKTVAPVYRIGYLIASKNFISEAANQRRIIDRQGDAILELTFANFIKNGNLDRHIKKIIKIYKNRRDLFCMLLKKELSDFFLFDIPKGGMAVWVILSKNYSWKTVSKIAKKHHLEIGDWQRYNNSDIKHNAIRIGFANYTNEEIFLVIEKLKYTMNEIKAKTILS